MDGGRGLGWVGERGGDLGVGEGGRGGGAGRAFLNRYR